MHTKCGKKGYMAIKVDLEKAYDRLRWTFIRETLEDIGLPSNLINLIRESLEDIGLLADYMH
jgi:Reverse transcriptase (RNA-dependent DNA polymerase)